MRPSSGVHPLTESAALLCRFCIQFWSLGRFSQGMNTETCYERERERTNIKQRCVLTDIREAKQFSNSKKFLITFYVCSAYFLTCIRGLLNTPTYFGHTTPSLGLYHIKGKI
jgi:hypothetical protein